MRKTLGIIFILLLTTLTQTFAQSQPLDKIAGVVGNTIILKSDIDQQYAQALMQGSQENPELKCYILQQMLTQKLLAQQAVIDSVSVTEDEVEDEINRRLRIMTSRAGGQERLEEFLNRSVIQYKDEMRPDVREQLVANKMQGKITEKVTITPLEVKRYFEAIPKDSLPYYNAEVEVGEIVIYPKLTKEEKQSFRDKAESLRLRVKGGEDFGTLARLYSQDPGSAAEGGDLGFMDRTMLVKEFAAMAFKLKPGDLSPVFETEYGFHVLQVMERRGEQVRARHILIKTEPTAASLERTKSHIDSIYQDVVNNKIPFSTAASLYSDDNETKYNGGMMLNAENVQSRTTYIPTDKLDPQVFLTIDTMKVGTYSKPELFTDKSGKQAYHFLYLKSRTEPHKANLDQDFPKIKDVALEDKLSRTVSEWFEKRRKATYIKIADEYQNCSSLKIWTSPDK
ncbi:peptidylprolyl isomerase [Rubrolithibacter danxiaensis]|uniref:peptidylprolyl isomerase n=1 Tax=Rubrolithibacter danxiaensis TaxID=3390805 RepID=UPI003BF79501